VRLKVAVIFRRKADLCDQRMLDHDHNGTVSDKEKDASEIATAYSPILPASLQKPTDWKAWAGNVQVAFGKAFSLLRRLETDADTDEDMQPERSQGSAVWLMRRSMLTKAETKATVSSFYAPAPLAIALRSGQVQVPLATGGSTEINARDIDLNAIAANAVGTLERLVSQTVGASLCQWQPGLYSRLALAKRDVADAMAGRLESILKNGSNLPEDAKKKFLNACREDTRTSFAPVAVVNAHLTPAATGRTFLWGTVNIAAPNVKPEELSFSFSPVSIPLGANGIEGSFDFVVQWAGLSVTPPAVVSGLMIVRPQYVQVTGDNTGDKDIIGYIPSDWYEVIWSDELGGEDMAKITVLTNTGPEWDIPLPLRLIPPTPTILRHGHQPGVPEDADDLDGYIRKARYWEYGVSVMVPAMDHDTTEVTMRFSDAAKLALLAHDPLFEVLVAYNHHAQAIDAVANELVATGKANENNLKFAIDLFEHVAEALAARAKYSTTLLPPHEDVRVVKLRTKRRSPDPRQPLPAEISWTVFPLGHQQDVETALRSLPEEKDGDDILKPDATDSTKGIARYEPGRPLAEAAIIGVASLSPRHVSLSNLDVMVQGRAMPTVLARRNADLLVGKGKDIAPDFIFETPLRGAPDALVPRLAHIKRFDLSKGTPPQPIHSWLLKLYQALVRDADADKFAFDVSARIRLPLVRDRNTVIESFIPQAAVKSAPASERDWIATLAGHYLAAIKVLSTQARQEGELEIKVQVFTASMGDSHKPVLSLTGLYLPLAKVTDDGVTPFVRTNQLALHQVAAYVFERTRCMTAEAAAAYREAFAIDAVRDPDEVVAAYLPSPAELASMEGREAWVAALQAAEAALTLTD
jgi:hypothetical protein